MDEFLDLMLEHIPPDDGAKLNIPEVRRVVDLTLGRESDDVEFDEFINVCNTRVVKPRGD